MNVFGLSFEQLTGTNVILRINFKQVCHDHWEFYVVMH